MSVSTQPCPSLDAKRALVFHAPAAAREGGLEAAGGASLQPPAKRARSAIGPAAVPDGGCQDCGRRGLGFRDDTDDQCYCSDCWLAFYGQLPSGAAAATSGSKAGGGCKAGSAPSAPVAAAAGGAGRAGGGGEAAATGKASDGYKASDSFKVKEGCKAADSFRAADTCRSQDRDGLAANPGAAAGALPEDAPRGHVAHNACKYGGAANCPLVKFKYKGEVPFQTTVVAAGNSRHAAEVICRACYLKFEAGWSKDQVIKFRNECYARLRGGAKPWAGRSPQQHTPRSPSKPAPAALSGSQARAAPPRTAAAPSASCSQAAAGTAAAAAHRGRSASGVGGGVGGGGGQGQTPSSQGLAAAAKRAPLVVRSAPFAAPAPPAPGPAPMAPPAGWVPSGYLRCFLDDPSKAPPAPANEMRQEARSRSPARVRSGAEQAAADRPAGAAAGLRMGNVAAALRLSGAVPRPSGGLVHRSRPSLTGSGLVESPTPQLAAAACAGAEQLRSDSAEQLRSDTASASGRYPAAGGPGQRPLPLLRAGGAEEGDEECSQPTPQLAQQTPINLRRCAGSEVFDPTPQLDEPTPCLSLSTPCLTPLKPLVLPPRLPPKQAEPSKQPTDSPERPTPCLFGSAIMA